MSGGRVNQPGNPKRNFAQIRNSWLRDDRLSFRARGILAMLASHDDGFEVPLKRIRTEREGPAAILSAVRELEALGYVERKRPRNEDGTYGGADWWLFDPEELSTDPSPGCE